MQALLDLAKKHGFVDAALTCAAQPGAQHDGRPVLVTIWGYKRAATHGEARMSSYYFASQKAYKALRALAVSMNQAGYSCRMDAELYLKPLALQAGLGVLGRNSLVLHPVYGGQIVLGALALAFEPGDIPSLQPTRTCEDCHACENACPGKALSCFAQIDRERCLRNEMLSGQPYPLAQRVAVGKRLIGCDNCLESCPHNRGLVKAERDEEPALAALLDQDTETYRQLKVSIGSNFARKERVLAQALLVAGNSGNPVYLPQAHALLNHPNPTIANHAAWCVAKLQKNT